MILTFEEARIIGSLIEKELTTPEYYPLTINSLKNACNQKSNREPVVNFDESLIEETLEKLREKKLAVRVTGSDMRVPKYKQRFTEELKLSLEEKAVMCVLILRGPQTPGEIKGRTGRMFSFEKLEQVDEVLQNLMHKEEPFIVKLPRQTGMKESRFAHLLFGESEMINSSEEASSASGNEERILKLEEEIQTLKNEMHELKDQFEKFKKQFE